MRCTSAICVSTKDSSPSKFETKKVQKDEEYIFSYFLPQTAGSEERRDSFRHGSYHGGRKPDTIQLQADRRSEVMGHQRRACHGQKHGGTRNEPPARQDARAHQQALSGNHGA